MSLDHSEFVRSSRIAESLSRSDPELARELAAHTASLALDRAVLRGAIRVRVRRPGSRGDQRYHLAEQLHPAQCVAQGRQGGGGLATAGSRPGRRALRWAPCPGDGPFLSTTAPPRLPDDFGRPLAGMTDGVISGWATWVEIEVEGIGRLRSEVVAARENAGLATAAAFGRRLTGCRCGGAGNRRFSSGAVSGLNLCPLSAWW
jgi:hypothetical protein